MRIGGFQKLTLVDYPGKTAATVFTQGCNFRCGFCHNAELVIPEFFCEPIPPQEVLDFLKTRRGKLEGVVISGGEPTIQQGLDEFIVSLKAMGFSLKLDTNGSRPDVLSSLIERQLIDFIAMDIKTSLEKYPALIQVPCDTAFIKRSIDLIQQSGLPHQFRTTVIKGFDLPQDRQAIASLINGSADHVRQSFKVSPKMVDPQFARIA